MLQNVRTKGQGISTQNKSPHLLSCDGYRKLEEKKMKEKEKARPTPFKDDCPQLPPPPTHDEK